MKTLRIVVVALVALAVVVLGGPPSSASPGTTERVSVDSAGSQSDDWSFRPAISQDGRFVTFWSDASNLVAGDTNDRGDIFVHDRQTGTTERVSVDSDGNEGNEGSKFCAISSDGRYVAFGSSASNLVPGDTNDAHDMFVHDRQTGSTERVSVHSAGNEANGSSWVPAISADGRYVAFYSDASNLVEGDTNGTLDVFVHDRETSIAERVSVDSDGNEGNGFSTFPAISGDGRYVAFMSHASNLVEGDTNGHPDVFVHDRETSITERVSVDSSGSQSDDWSWFPAISSDGGYVAFASDAWNLVPDDTNGTTDIFTHDRETSITERVSVDGGGSQSDDWSCTPDISDGGRYVTFYSAASDLVPDDTNNFCGSGGDENCADVFVHDRQTGTTARVSVDSDGNEGSGDDLNTCNVIVLLHGSPSISGDGRYVGFGSDASDLVPDDTNETLDIFVHDLGDADGDDEWDPFDPCPNDPDCDDDGFSDHAELYIATDPLDACPDVLGTPGLCPGPSCDGDDCWPPDLDVDRDVDIVDVLAAFKNKILIPAAYDPRSDFDTDGDLDIPDVLAGYKETILTSCTP